jgi:hypothetical protein
MEVVDAQFPDISPEIAPEMSARACVPTISPETPAETPAEERAAPAVIVSADPAPPPLSEADARMQLQRGYRRRTVTIQYATNGGPIRIHRGPRPNGKAVRKARVAARRAKKALEAAQAAEAESLPAEVES